MIELSLFQWLIILFCAIMAGFAKAGLPGSGIIVPVIMAAIMPARESTGFLLPILAMADILAIIYWRRHVAWKQLIRLLPWAWLGIIAGYLQMGLISNEHLKLFIGSLVLVLMGLSWFREKKVPDDSIPTHWLFAALMGVLAGMTSMMANAAGPIMVIYLMAMRLKKKAFIGTSAWFFWIVNLSKLPFSHRLDLITAETLKANMVTVPFIITGGILGVLAAHTIPQKTFNTVVKILAASAAIYLCLPV